MTLLYDISLLMYYAGIFVARFFNEKAKKWFEGRRNIFTILERADFKGGNTIWMHCASLGEFEQGRPVIESIKKQYPKYKIILTFFSPSGYEIRKNYPLADHITYLPPDSKRNAIAFINRIRPAMVLFIKYEFWFHYLKELHNRGIPVYLLSASFRKNQHFFQWYGKWFRKMLQFYKHIFVQDAISYSLLEGIGINKVTTSGDTRFDRVYQTMQAAEELAIIKIFKDEKRLFIAGSTWPEDEHILARLNLTDHRLKMIIAPHDVSDKNIQRITSFFPGNIIRYSQAEKKEEKARNEALREARVLIVDSIGLLSKLYRYGDIAYIGGAFGRSLHNILEPAAFGLPVIFGPDYYKNWEAAALIEKGGAFSIKNSEEFLDKINFLLHDEMILKIASEMSRSFVRANTGATQKILEEIKTDK